MSWQHTTARSDGAVRLLFTSDAHAGLRSGEITLTFRAWKRPQARAGGRHRVHGVGTLVVDDARLVPTSSITEDDARRAGAPDRAALLRRLGGATQVWRVAFHLDDAPPPPGPSEDEVLRRLRRLPWALDVLRLVRDRPATVSTELAAALGRERLPFKADVRRLKALGLTESLAVGYRLTPLGERVTSALEGGEQLREGPVEGPPVGG